MFIMISEDAIDQIMMWSEEASPFETGGVLLGLLVGEVSWITQSVEIPSDHPSVSSYTIPPGKTQEAVRKARIKDKRVGYLGDWHSHSIDAGPSHKDIRSLQQIVSWALRINERRPAMVVARATSEGWILQAYTSHWWWQAPRALEIRRTGPLLSMHP